MCLLKFVYRCACVLIVSYICCFSKVILYFVQLIRSSEWVWIWWVANYQHDLVYVAVWIHMLCFPMMWDNFTCCCIAEKELDEPLCTAQSSTIVDARRHTSTHSSGWFSWISKQLQALFTPMTMGDLKGTWTDVYRFPAEPTAKQTWTSNAVRPFLSVCRHCRSYTATTFRFSATCTQSRFRSQASLCLQLTAKALRQGICSMLHVLLRL